MNYFPPYFVPVKLRRLRDCFEFLNSALLWVAVLDCLDRNIVAPN